MHSSLLSRWSTPIVVLLLLGVWLRNELLLLIAILLGLMAGAVWLWLRYGLTALTYRRRFTNRRLYLGEESDLFVEIVNAKPLPLPWLRIDDTIPAGMPLFSMQAEDVLDASRNLVNVLSLRWYERVTRRYRVRAAQRGEWKFGPARLRSGDLFGFDIQQRVDEAPPGAPGDASSGVPDSVIVFPRIVPVTQLKLPAHHPFGDFRTQQRLITDPLRLMGVRDYAEGDTFRHVHWKATARRQSLQTKVFEPSASQPVVLFLNVNTEERYYLGYDPELREYAICAAASIARHLWQEGRPVGLVTNAIVPGTRHYARITPAAHADQLLQILTALARIDMGWGQWGIDRLLQVEMRHLPYGATVVVVSAVLSRLLEESLHDLRRRGFGVTLVLLGKAQNTPRLAGIQVYHIGSYEEWSSLEKLELDR